MKILILTCPGQLLSRLREHMQLAQKEATAIYPGAMAIFHAAAIGLLVKAMPGATEALTYYLQSWRANPPPRPCRRPSRRRRRPLEARLQTRCCRHCPPRQSFCCFGQSQDALPYSPPHLHSRALVSSHPN